MRIVTFQHNDGQRLGVRDGDDIIDLTQASADLPTELVDLIKLGQSGLDQVQTAVSNAPSSARIPLSEITYLPPTSRAGKIICLGLNYADHAAEGGHQKPEYPSFFMRGNSTLVAHEAPILRPIVSEQLDYEAELVAIIGKSARHVSEADALDYVWGYSVFNEASIRDRAARVKR